MLALYCLKIWVTTMMNRNKNRIALEYYQTYYKIYNNSKVM